MRRESGFTLVELLVVVGMTAVLLTLSASAIRHYWFRQSLDGAAEQVVNDLRNLQQETIAESHPVVFGAWFRTGTPSGGQYGILKFDPKDVSISSDDVCTLVDSPQTFGNMVSITAVNFDTASEIEPVCGPVAPAGSEKVFFYARGSATAGSLTLHQPDIGEVTVNVSAVTGRVEAQ